MPDRSMRLRITSLAAALCIGWLGAVDANGIEIRLSPRQRVAAVGDYVQFDILFDSGGEPILSGGLDVIFDPRILEPVNFEFSDAIDPNFQNDPIKRDGRLEGLVAGNFGGIASPSRLFTLTFRVLGEGVSPIRMMTAQNLPWTSAVDFSVLYPEYFGAIVASGGIEYPLANVASEARFGPVPIGELSTVDVEIDNLGTGVLNVHGAAFDDPPDGFSIVADPCSGQSVPAGSTCRITVGYETAQLDLNRLEVTELVIETSDLLRPEHRVDIIVDIAAPRLRAASLEFFESRPGAPVRQQSTTFRNIGTWPTVVDSVVISGSNLPPGIFAISQDECTGRYLDVDDTCALTVTYSPQELRVYAGILTASYSDDLYRDFSSVSGYPPTGLPLVHYDGPQSITIAVGDQEERHITITNKGSTTLNMVSVGADNEPGFTLLGSDCEGAALATGEHCSIDVRIQPPQPGDYVYSVVVSSDSEYDQLLLLRLTVEAVAGPARGNRRRTTERVLSN